MRIKQVNEQDGGVSMLQLRTEQDACIPEYICADALRQILGSVCNLLTDICELIPDSCKLIAVTMRKQMHIG